MGVSIPAVNKWEADNSYADIVLFPLLARLLKVDMNTLFDFERELSSKKIGELVNSIGDKIFKEEYSKVFEQAKGYINKYPNDDVLLSSMAMVLNGGLHFSDTLNKEGFQDKLDCWYMKLAKSNRFEIKTSAISMLIISSQNKKEYIKAKEYIDSLPSIPYKKKELGLNLALAKEDYQQTLINCQEQLISQVVDLQNSLFSLFDIYETRIKERSRGG